jgi:hypothetical protein
MTAFSVNMGITPYDVLSVANGDFSNQRGCTRLTDLVTPGQTYHQNTPYMTWSDQDGCVMTFNNSITKELDKYSIDLRIDQKFANMDPVYCLSRTYSSAPAETYLFERVCLVRTGDTFIYPHFNHMGTTGSEQSDFYNFAKGCSCNPMPAFDPAGNFYSTGENANSSYCNVFDLVHGFIIINSKYADEIFFKLLRMASYQSAEKINEAAYFPAFGAVRTGGNGGHNQVTISNGKTQFNDALSYLKGGISNSIIGPNSPFSFCQDDTNGCVIFAVNTYDIYNQRINKDFFDLVNGNCQDSFTMDETVWYNSTGPYDNPPTSLIQDYYECYNQLYVRNNIIHH